MLFIGELGAWGVRRASLNNRMNEAQNGKTAHSERRTALARERARAHTCLYVCYDYDIMIKTYSFIYKE